MKFSWFLTIILLVFVAVFSVQNAEPITVHFLTWSGAVSSALVIQLAALLGGLVGLAIGAVSARRSRRMREDAQLAEGRRAREEAARLARDAAHPAESEVAGRPADRIGRDELV